MRQFWKVIKRFAWRYKSCIFGSIGLNILSAVFNIFSFALIIPILRMIFGIQAMEDYQFIAWDSADIGIKDLIINNMYFYVTEVIKTQGPSKVLLGLGLGLGLMTFIKCACYFGSAAVMIPMRTGILRDIRVQMYDKIMSLHLGFFSEERKGDIVARMSGDVGEVESCITNSLDMLVKNPILITFYFGALIFLSWQMTLFTILVAPLIVLIMSMIAKRLKKQSLEAQGFWSDIMSQLDETLGGLRIIKAFIAEGKMSRRFAGTNENYRNARNRVSYRQALAHPVSEFLGTCMIMLVLWYGGSLILRDNAPFDAPTFIFYMVILYSVIQPLKDFSKAAYDIPKGLASMERIDKILLAENEIKEKEGAKVIRSFEHEIEYKGVSFRYPDGMREVLEDINIKIGKGKTIAIVGQSGSGKSTLVDLLPRYYDIVSGSISVDGIDIRELKIHDLRSLIGNVNQEAILFNDTIFNNIAFGVENTTKEEVIAAAKIANAHDFIMEKEKGYDEFIGDRGCKLSGGQRQRISIARAILKNPPILILDEATSALDTESEKLVQEALDRLTSERTTIAIAHRLSTIRNADEICVMHEGRIVERGRHEELLALNGYYRKLNDMQAL